MDRHTFLCVVATGMGALLLTPVMAACTGRAGSEPNPNQARQFGFSIDLNDKTYVNLKTKGGYVVVNNIIVAQTNAGQYLAVGAKCPHQGTQLIYRPTDNQFYCPLDLSRFDATGKVIGGPATQPLTQYAVVLDAKAGLLQVRN